MTTNEIAVQIIQLKEARTLIYPELTAAANKLKQQRAARQKPCDQLTNHRNELQNRVNELSVQIDKLTLQKNEIQQANNEREKYHGAIRKIACAILANPEHPSFSQEDIIEEAVEIEAAIRQIPVPQS